MLCSLLAGITNALLRESRMPDGLKAIPICTLLNKHEDTMPLIDCSASSFFLYGKRLLSGMPSSFRHIKKPLIVVRTFTQRELEAL